MPGLVLDFAENFYGVSIHEIAARIKSLEERGSAKNIPRPSMKPIPPEKQRKVFLASELFDAGEERAWLDASMAAHSDAMKAMEEFLRPREFVGLYREQLTSQTELPPLGEGELRPVFGRAGQSFLNYRFDPSKPGTSTLDLLGIVNALYGTFSRGESSEVKSILLYAHSSILLDPLARRPELERDAITELNHTFLSSWGHSPHLKGTMSQAGRPIEERLSDFADILVGLSILEPLIRDGTVTVATPPDPHALYFGDELSLRDRVSFVLYRLGVIPSPQHDDGRALAQVLLLRAKEQILSLLAFGDMSTVFAASQLDVVGLVLLLDEMVRSGSIPPQNVERSQEDERLTEFASLRLPGVDRVNPLDMVAIRRDDLFERFRADVRTGLRSASEENDLQAAQQGFSGEMRAAVQRLDGGVKRSALDRAIGGDAIGWIIGALVGWSIDNWRGAILGLTGKAAYELRRGRERAGHRSLRNHYVALS